MFGRVEQAIDRNVVICLAVVAAVLLLTGLVIAVASPAARAHRGTAQPGAPQPGAAKPITRLSGQVRAAPAGR
jgi:hypothetical protein